MMSVYVCICGYFIMQLSLQGCQGVSDHFLQALLAGSLLPSLISLDLGWVNLFSSSAAEQLSRARPHLEITGALRMHIHTCIHNIAVCNWLKIVVIVASWIYFVVYFFMFVLLMLSLSHDVSIAHVA
jgi:hypothetical protein